MRRSLIYFISFSMIALATVSCNDSERDSDTTLVSASEVAQAQTVLFNIFKYVHQRAVYDEFFTDTLFTGGLNLDCDSNYSIRTTLGTFPLVMQTSFTQGASCADRVIESGTLTASFNGIYDRMLNRITVSCDSLQLLEQTVDGVFDFRIIQVGDTQRFEYNTNNLSVFNDTANYFLTTNMNIDWVSGVDSESTNDDEFRLTGFFSGISHEGNEFEGEILEPITNSFGCNYLQNGQVQVNANSKEPRLISFDSNCNRSYTIQIAGRTENLSLP